MAELFDKFERKSDGLAVCPRSFAAGYVAGRTQDRWCYDMSKAPKIEHKAFYIARPKNDVSDFVVEQVSVFEGGIYRDFENGLIDYDDRITDAYAWCPIEFLPPPPLTHRK